MAPTSYVPSLADIRLVEEVFVFHPVQPGQAERYEHLRAAAKELAHDFMILCPPSRERSVAITNLQQAIMWANAAIAINEEPPLVDVTGPEDDEPRFVTGER